MQTELKSKIIREFLEDLNLTIHIPLHAYNHRCECIWQTDDRGVYCDLLKSARPYQIVDRFGDALVSVDIIENHDIVSVNCAGGNVDHRRIWSPLLFIDDPEYFNLLAEFIKIAIDYNELSINLIDHNCDPRGYPLVPADWCLESSWMIE